MRRQITGKRSKPTWTLRFTTWRAPMIKSPLVLRNTNTKTKIDRHQGRWPRALLDSSVLHHGDRRNAVWVPGIAATAVGIPGSFSYVLVLFAISLLTDVVRCPKGQASRTESKDHMAGYGKKAQAMVKEAMEKIKDGALKRGKGGKKERAENRL